MVWIWLSTAVVLIGAELDAEMEQPDRARAHFLTTQKLQPVHFAGLSLGGTVVMECARTAPERVASMLLLAPAGIAREGVLIHFRIARLLRRRRWLG
jgi:pimeloyl-ACP methyl ester carboxylesterase